MSQEHLNIIKDIAKQAGDKALDYQAKISSLNVKTKGIGDFVSQADTECEGFIKKELNKNFKGFSFLAEESGEEDHNSDYLWIIDPIDGTTNFLKGLKEFSCSICLQEKGKTIVSVVYFPAMGELYYASRDKKGAFMEYTNSEKPTAKSIECNQKTTLSESLISYGIGKSCFEKTNSIMKHLSEVSGGIRSIGVSSLDLIRVARGEFGAYIKSSIQKWDLYPASYIAEKAGAVIYTIHGEETAKVEDYNSEREGCIVANKNIITEIIENTKPKFDKNLETAKEIYSDKICPLANKAVETSTPYVKEACKKSNSLLRKAFRKFIELCKKYSPYAKEYLIKAWELIKENAIKSKPYIIKGALWTKNKSVELAIILKNKLVKKDK
ncbi:MAG: inositol monophosphatase [Alphaproteobacteria bacterium]|jgi:myo-inositol-1(or 4)-monophosphatase|nr:inositol monophosphatase [Alphaproteobacteria bacterium]